MCIDFTELNKCCPKDDFPLPRIDSSVDKAAACELFSLLDCFLGYHQIWMEPEYEENTSFITQVGTYCFTRMHEGLKNDVPSFARMTKQIFGDQVGRNILAYVDDIVVMSKRKDQHIADIHETFANLRTAGLKLNPEKCVFVVKEEKYWDI